MFLNKRSNYSLNKIAGGADFLISIGMLFVYMLSNGLGYVSYLLAFLGYSMMIVGTYILSDNNNWMKYAFYASVANIVLYSLGCIASAFPLPYWFGYLSSMRYLLQNLLIVFMLVSLHYGITHIFMENKKEFRKKLFWSGLIILVYILLNFLAVLLNSMLLYYIVYLASMFVFMIAILLAYLALREFTVQPFQIILKAKKPGILASAGGSVLILAVIVILLLAVVRVPASESSALKETKTDVTNEVRQQLNTWGIPSKYTDLIDDDEIERYKDAISATQVKSMDMTGYQFVANENGEINGETEEVTSVGETTAKEENASSKEETSSETKGKEETQTATTENGTDKASATKDSEENTTAAQETVSIEDVKLYCITLSTGDQRILCFYEPAANYASRMRYREGVFISVKSVQNLNMTDANGKGIFTKDGTDYESVFTTFYTNTDLEKLQNGKEDTYSSGYNTDPEVYKATDKNSNLLAITNGDSSSASDRKGYVAFTIKNNGSSSDTVYITVKYIAQMIPFNYPYENMEEILMRYVDGYYDTNFYTMKKAVWSVIF